ncbi:MULTISPECIES: hypothetical protein [Acinetobacter]|uniref:Uncharacterized protein n=1 Tax=Acinetobacter lwoffii TaxID=28090 RepID=A0A6N1N4D1_ACILW|nr:MULTISPECIES: hypothetical protein [Acinetobacter]QKU21875.1 hypothetical protein FOB19_10970 [Acinetobacter lwoffii]
MGNKYSDLSKIISEAVSLGREAAKTVDDGGTANNDRICISGLKGVRESTLNNAGINCYKHWSFPGTFILSSSFGQGNKNCKGLSVALDHMKNNGVDCYMHWQMD